MTSITGPRGNRTPGGPASGFTLIETLVVVVVIGLIGAVLGLAVTTVLRNENSVSSRLTETRDLQNLANYLPRDVASARLISTDTSPPGECGSGGTVRLHLEWDEEWRGVLFSARITYREFVSGGNTLIRFECLNDGPATEVTLAQVYQAATFTCPPVDATVIANLDFADGSRSITATSRNFPSDEDCASS